MANLAQRAKKDPRLLRRALKNPGLRSKLPSSMLTSQQRAQRGRNTAAAKHKAGAQKRKDFWGQPIMAGSTMTRRQLVNQSRNATKVRYAPLEAAQKRDVGEAQAWERDTGNYYDQYLQQVAQQSQNVQNIGAQAQQAVQGLQAGVTGLAGADLKSIQQPANADAQARGAVAGDQSQMASNAAAVRQALVGSFAAEQAARNAATSTEAGTRAHVVAPGQKLQAVAQAHGRVRQAREKQADTARERGAYSLQQREELRAGESKNVLAREIATGKSAVDLAQLGETKRSHKANERAAQDRIAAGRESAADRKAIAEGKINAYGYTDKDWKAMTTAQRRKIIAAKGGGKGSGKDGKDGGIDFQTGGQRGTAMSQLGYIKGLVGKAKTGVKFEPTGKEKGPGTKLGRHGAAVKINEYAAGKIKDPVLLSAALDAHYGHPPGLSPTTVRRLHNAGYRVDEVLAALGTTTQRQAAKGRTRANTEAYGRTRPQPQGHA